LLADTGAEVMVVNLQRTRTAVQRTIVPTLF